MAYDRETIDLKLTNPKVIQKEKLNDALREYFKSTKEQFRGHVFVEDCILQITFGPDYMIRTSRILSDISVLFDHADKLILVKEGDNYYFATKSRDGKRCLIGETNISKKHETHSGPTRDVGFSSGGGGSIPVISTTPRDYQADLDDRYDYDSSCK
ncbi:MAG: hypothetical protein ABIG93_03400 [archaeon]|nr:hypothetical protein [Nanoarchaeota archaeon]